MKRVVQTGTSRGEQRYPPIADYGFIADCHAAALVSREGSIDWCCIPRIDSASCFGRLVGWDRGGYCKIAPTGSFRVERRYMDHTLILETLFRTDTGVLRLLDFFPLRSGGRTDPHRQLLRIVEGVSGEVEIGVEIVPRFEYGALRPWIKPYRGDSYAVMGGCTALLVSGDFHLSQPDRHALKATAVVTSGQTRRLSILYRPPKELDDNRATVPGADELDARLRETIGLWQAWATKGRVSGPLAAQACRSALVLKGLTHAPTGAIAAAATTSLPEALQGRRNWDYRYTWIRDSVFTVHSLAETGYLAEADEFRRFIERTAAGSAADLQIMFGVGGERRLEEYTVEMEGYRGARPVRVGNAAYRQMQFDIYGELMHLAWQWHLGGCSPDDDYWDFLVQVVRMVGRIWRRQDHGIWEIRGRRRHYVFSKVMCWSAVDKGIALAERLGRPAPLEEWRLLRERLRASIERQGYDGVRGIFVQHYGGQELDAALLRMPMTGFIAYTDPRMVRTVSAIQAGLSRDGLIMRYTPASDGFAEPEGIFVACSFWLAECLSRQGRRREAQDAFDRALAAGNDLGLFAEQFDPRSGEMLGNFPQGLTHLSLISAALSLGAIEKAGAKGHWQLTTAEFSPPP